MIALENAKTTAYAYQPIEIDFNVYLVTDRAKTDGRPLLKSTEDALKGGVRAVHLREKDLGTRGLLRLAYEMRELTLKYDARLFINDRVDIAVAVDADGVHLGQKSMPPFAVRRFAAGLIIGVSTHNAEEAMRAERDGADFITLGPVYQTPSKLIYGEPVGLRTLEEVLRRVRIPVFAIGGINHDNAKDVMDRGAHGVALISAIYSAKDIKAATLKFFKSMK